MSYHVSRSGHVAGTGHDGFRDVLADLELQHHIHLVSKVRVGHHVACCAPQRLVPLVGSIARIRHNIEYVRVCTQLKDHALSHAEVSKPR